MSNRTGSCDSNNTSHNSAAVKALDEAAAEALSAEVGAQIPLIAAAPRSNRWTFIQNDLSAALNTWQELEKSPLSLSPDEEEMLRIKTLIARLKDKLDQF